MKYLEQWFSRKTARSYAYLSEPATVKYTHHVHTGPRYIYGEVTLSASPAESFSFVSPVDWPENCNYNDYVLDGILDVLMMVDFMPLLGVAFELETIGWHNVDSVPVGYYFAAKEATRRILRIDEPSRNLAWKTKLGNE
ncbi:MAG: hypothetical protein GY832_16210 [Chloroflexi bacterium]|nr:hypothetical protein [Chloroflexota bacterium]